ncbi:hypothetical protein GB931_11730 [Modestobacter sp. I12A-02628]|uniref:Slipin family protein n=1 Tax=Goekera deserti TaxID=2497753 RepID=A0A7K3WCF4_9ACTN|nr:slipin family protein [Goekera deserti]MPQ98576.1 hypothetical protein [Goekera deserti]NDI49054.1 hypothetical protein [Goekera deserti]NEL54155.1 slipin family protein [Goekera deserti]
MRVVVQEWERVLVYRDGRFTTELGAGRYRLRRRRHAVVRVVVRPRLVVVGGQEVLTADGLSVRLSLAVTSRVVDPRRWHEAVEDADGFAYAGLQVALRDAVADRTLDELLGARGEVGERVRTLVEPTVAAVGVQVETVALRDVMVPAELRRAAAEVATARAQGQAVLERARSEVAATRALANAGRMLTGNPGLLQLRTLQAVEAGGATVVLTPGPTGVGPA